MERVCIFEPMKRIVSIGLLFLLVFQVAGYFMVFRLIQHDIRQNAWHGIDSGAGQEELVDLLVPNDPELAAAEGFIFEHNREIIYRGTYYDIVTRTGAGTHTRYTCYADHQESKLVKGMKDDPQAQKTEPPGRVSFLISLTLASYLANFFNWSDPLVQLKPDSHALYLISKMDWNADFPSPPPRINS